MRNRGFTLIELMVTVVILGLVIGMGLPAFSSLGNSMGQRQAREELRQRLRMARQAAVTRHCPVIVSFGDGSTLTGITTYSVLVDVNGDLQKQSTEPVSNYTLRRGCSMTLSGFTPTDTLEFDLSGALLPGTTGGRFYLQGSRTPDTLQISGIGMVYRP